MNKYLKYIIAIIISLFIFAIIIYLINNKKNNITKIYDSLVHIEAYDSNTTSNASGFVYKTDKNKAYIITNYHVVKEYSNIYVYNINGDKEEAEVLFSNNSNDIAVLTINNTLNLKECIIKESDKLNIGDEIFVVGSPIGDKYLGTITHGIISYLNRSITIKTDNGNISINTIQVDAPINPGNSGGPLIDKRGNVVGMISTKDDNADGVGFAIPINDIIKYVDKNINR